MATQVQLRRGTTAEHSSFTGAAGELTVDIDKKTAVVHDGSTAGGVPLLRENGAQNAVTTGTSTAASFIPTSGAVPTNGVYLPAANSVGLATNGSGRLFVDASGNVGVGTTSPDARLRVADANGCNLFVGFSSGVLNYNIYDATEHVFRTTNGSSELARINSSGRLLVGTSSGVAVNSTAQTIVQAESYYGYTAIQRSADAFGSTFYFVKSRGSGAATIVQSGDTLGTIVWNGADGTDYSNPAASIAAQVEGTPANNSVASRLVFSVTADGASSPTEAMRIKNSRIINFANAPTYADNTAALAGGLVAGDVYKKSDGTLMIAY